MMFCLYAAILGFFMSAYMFTPFFAFYIKDLGGSYGEFAAVLSVTGFLLSLVQSYIGYLSDKIGSKFLVIGGGSLAALGFLLIAIIFEGVFNTIMPLTDVISPIMTAFLIKIHLKAPYTAAFLFVMLFIVLSSCCMQKGDKEVEERT